MACSWPRSKIRKSSLSRLETNWPFEVVTVTGTMTSLTVTRIGSCANSRNVTNTPAYRPTCANPIVTLDYTVSGADPRPAIFAADLLWRGDFQLRQTIVERLLRRIDQSFISRRVDIWIGTTLFELAY